VTPRAAWVGLAAVTLCKLALAAHLSLRADEAYYWVWSLRPALGYYDQPPVIAWMIAATTAATGPTELGVRVGAIGCGVLGAAALAPFARDRALWLLWWAAVPSLAWLTLFSTSDAPLLAAWAVALAGACAGGRGWLVAGLGAGLAFQSKYSGAAVLPLLLLGAGPREWRSPWPWAGVVLAGAIAAPNLVWNAQHDWISFSFQLHEGLVHPRPPGVVGLLRQTFDQVLVLTPLLAAAGVAWAIQGLRAGARLDRLDRLALATSVPLVAFFAAASVFAPAEAHWPAPAYIGLGLGLSRAAGRLHRLAWVGAWFGALLSVVLAVHTLHPLVRVAADPALRVEEGPLVAEAVASWALPAGAAVADGTPERAATVYTERYQEAALVHFYTGIPATRYPGCGRRDQYDLWPTSPPTAGPLMVRPATSGDALCTDAAYPDRSGPQAIDARDRFGRRVGRWQLYVLGDRVAERP
jgi:4-amino-4-deoxy-L-arabinose transferase-like glycosyltransferase